MIRKTCSKCGRSLPATPKYFRHDSSRRDGLYPSCKACTTAYARAYHATHKREEAAYDRIYWATHKEEKAANRRAYCATHKEEIAAYHHAYQMVHREEYAAYRRVYRVGHKQEIADRRQRDWEHIREYKRQRYQANPMVRLSNAISRGMQESLHDGKSGRHWEALGGYTLGDLRQHLQVRFQPGMSWENHGEWEIDHVRPLSSFSFSSPDDPQFKECWALENLQPMWAYDNDSKGAKEPALLGTDQRAYRKGSRRKSCS